jgi:hypothetical protein
MQRAAVLLAMQFASMAICSGQIKIRLQDVSAKGSPLQVSGTVSFEDDSSKPIRYTYRPEGSIANVSGKGVTLFVIHFEAGGVNAPGLDYTYDEERFFGLDILEPGKTESIHNSPVRFGASTINGQPVPEDVGPDAVPAATAEVTFVQFVDGSTWGDPEAGHKSLIVRTQTFHELTRLEQVLEEGGERALKAEVSNMDIRFQPPCIGNLVRSCNNRAASCLADGLHSMIQAARQHETEMRTVPHQDATRNINTPNS